MNTKAFLSEDILNEVFDNYLDIMIDVFYCTKEEWHEKIEEKIRCKLEQGIIKQETAEQIRMELKEYMGTIYRDIQDMEAGWEIFQAYCEIAPRFEDASFRKKMDDMKAENRFCKGKWKAENFI